MSGFLKGVGSAERSFCVFSLNGLAGAMKVFGFVFLVMPFKEEVKLLVEQRPDIGSVEVHDLFSLRTPGWPCISHVSLGQSLLPYPVEGWCPLWGSCLDELSTAMKHPLESVLWILEQNKKSVLHSHVFPSILLVWVWCFHFLRWGAGVLSLLFSI